MKNKNVILHIFSLNLKSFPINLLATWLVELTRKIMDFYIKEIDKYFERLCNLVNMKNKKLEMEKAKNK